MDAFSSAQLQYDQKLFNVIILLIFVSLPLVFQTKTSLGFIGTACEEQLFREKYYAFKSVSAFGFSSSFGFSFFFLRIKKEKVEVK